MNKALRARNSVFLDYWFTDDAILRVRIVSLASFVAIPVVTSILLLSLLFLLVDFAPNVISPSTQALFGPLVFAVAVGIAFLLPGMRQGRLSALSPEELAKKKSTLRIPWSSVSSVEVKSGYIEIETERKNYRAFVGKTEEMAIRDFVNSRLGRRMQQ